MGDVAVLTFNKITMQSKHHAYIRVVAIGVTLIVTLGASYLPKKQFSLAPSDDIFQALFDDRSYGGVSETEWLNAADRRWVCSMRESNEYPSCGYSLSFNRPNGEGIDFSRYQGFVFKVNYSGDAERIRIFLRNHKPDYAADIEPGESKFMSLFIRRQDLNKELFIDFNEFNVADWWLTEFNVPRPYTAPDFDNVVAFGFDMVTLGNHQITIEKLHLVGDLMQREQVYLGIILLWMALLMTEAAIWYARLILKSRSSDEKLSQLRNDYDVLHEEKVEFERKSTTDFLTRTQNRTGIHQQLNFILENSNDRSCIGILIFDIDHFKRINDRRGHDTGDRVLKEMADVLRSNTRDTDLLGRWGGEEFILVCPNINESNLKELGEKIRATVSRYPFEHNAPITVTISIGMTLFKHLENFDPAFKRADDALYHAKNSGRNCCVFKANK